jgi:membrane fusion protein (multidrug efflux system)
MAEGTPQTRLPPSASGRAASPTDRNPALRRRFAALGIVVALVVIGGGAYWFITRNDVSTDDAFIDGNVVQVAPRISGTVLTLDVTDNQTVRRGDVLLTLDPRDDEVAVKNAQAALANAEAEARVAAANLSLTKASTAAALEQAEAGVALARAALEQAQAQVTAAEAQAYRAKRDEARYEKLLTADYASRQRYEQAQSDSRTSNAQLVAAQAGVTLAEAQLGQAQGRLDDAKTAPDQIAVREATLQAAEAQANAARAQLDQAELNLSYTKLVAPEDGVVTRRQVNVGDQVDRSQNLMALVVGRPWVTANFKETQLAAMQPGQPVKVEVDAYRKSFRAHVDSIQRGTGARFALLPPENATGNYIKVVQRVPVKIVFDDPPDPRFPLGLGMSVVPTVDVGAAPASHRP